jgi:hypothetical protein
MLSTASNHDDSAHLQCMHGNAAGLVSSNERWRQVGDFRPLGYPVALSVGGADRKSQAVLWFCEGEGR